MPNMYGHTPFQTGHLLYRPVGLRVARSCRTRAPLCSIIATLDDLWHNGRDMAQTTVAIRVGPQGRIVVPRVLRDALGLVPGDDLVAYVDEERLILERRDLMLARIQGEFLRAVPSDVSLADELISERRREAEREQE